MLLHSGAQTEVFFHGFRAFWPIGAQILQKRPLDPTDVRILAALQAHGRMSSIELGEAVHLSASQCHRRMKRLEEDGVIAAYTAVLDPEAVGLGLLAFIAVTLARHGGEPARRFEDAVRRLPEVLECHSISGEADYLLRVVAPDLKAFSDFMMNDLVAIPGVASVRSNIALQPVKRGGALPLAHLAGGAARTAPAKRGPR
ncbi:MAG: Lrp/AsnC family transcriptional regulator [Hyphomicrobiales bacterium]|nr:Lrp/AsnC family transcriptional regulator [Hyphomicrobiales bacterium]